MFGFNKENLPSTGARVLKALEIHEGVTLKTIEYQLLKERYNAAVLTFSKVEGGVESILVENLLEPTNAKPKKKGSVMETQKEANERVARLFNAKLKHIANAFQVKEEELESIGETNSFKEFISRFAEVMSKTRENTVNLKVVLNSKGYPSLPAYPPFVEPSGTVTLKITEDELNHAKNLEEQEGVEDQTTTSNPAIDELL